MTICVKRNKWKIQFGHQYTCTINNWDHCLLVIIIMNTIEVFYTQLELLKRAISNLSYI